jgi:tRNA(fMet)-specific endonuclease VapC
MLDTNMCIYLMSHQPEQVARRFAQCYVGDVVMSAITFAELECGVTVSRNRAHERRHLMALVEDIQVVPFDAGAATS